MSRARGGAVDAAEDRLYVGCRVEAKLKDWQQYYPGQVTYIDRDGTVDIKFDDGEAQSRVDPRFIRLAAAPRRSPDREGYARAEVGGDIARAVRRAFNALVNSGKLRGGLREVFVRMDRGQRDRLSEADILRGLTEINFQVGRTPLLDILPEQHANSAALVLFSPTPVFQLL